MRKRVASLRADDAGRSVHGLRKREKRREKESRGKQRKGKERRGVERKERFSDEGEKRACEKTRRRKSIGGRWKEKRAAEERRRDGGRAEGYAVERWWIEEGRGRVGSGVEGLPGWREAGGGGGGGEGGR